MRKTAGRTCGRSPEGLAEDHWKSYRIYCRKKETGLCPARPYEKTMDTENNDMMYKKVTGEILAIPRFTRDKHDFSVLRKYLAGLGDPQQGRRVIHVAGTNGKGSVTRMITGLLMETGRRVGSFYSPHLVRMNERIRINGEEITDALLTESYMAVESVRKTGGLPQLTFFEVLFVMALYCFRAEGAEDIVLETGLGGRLDATTSIPADLYIITQIGLDHEAYLGNTVEEVAREKAGIITGSSPVVYHTKDPLADRVIEDKAGEMQAFPCVNCAMAEVSVDKIDASGIDFSVQNDYYKYQHLFLPRPVLYQTENAVTMIEAARFLLSDLSEEQRETFIRRSLEGFSWEGRLSEVRPDLYLDGAHNPSAAKCLVRTLGQMPALRDRDLRLIYGASADKNIRGVLGCLAGIPWKELWIVPYRGERSDSAEHLKKLAEELLPGIGISAFDRVEDVMDRLDMESRQAQKPVSIVAGSLYLVGEILELLPGYGRKDRSGTDQTKTD